MEYFFFTDKAASLQIKGEMQRFLRHTYITQSFHGPGKTEKVGSQMLPHTEKRYGRKGNALIFFRSGRIEEGMIRFQFLWNKNVKHGVLRASIALRRKHQRRTHGFSSSCNGKDQFVFRILT